MCTFLFCLTPPTSSPPSPPRTYKTRNSFATAVSEVTRGSSAGSGGKGHVKSASVSSPGPSVENGAPTDPLGPRYQSKLQLNDDDDFF